MGQPPAAVAQWLALRDLGRQITGSIPVNFLRGFSALIGSYPERVCCGPNGKAGTTQPSLIHFTDAH